MTVFVQSSEATVSWSSSSLIFSWDSFAYQTRDSFETVGAQPVLFGCHYIYLWYTYYLRLGHVNRLNTQVGTWWNTTFNAAFYAVCVSIFMTVSSIHIYIFIVSWAFVTVAASQAWDADSSRAHGLTSDLQGSVNVHRGALLLVPQWPCISSFVFYSTHGVPVGLLST